jgi:hypothetical protein
MIEYDRLIISLIRRIFSYNPYFILRHGLPNTPSGYKSRTFIFNVLSQYHPFDILPLLTFPAGLHIQINSLRNTRF